MHPMFGEGVVLNIEGRGANARIEVNFAEEANGYYYSMPIFRLCELLMKEKTVLPVVVVALVGALVLTLGLWAMNASNQTRRRQWKVRTDPERFEWKLLRHGRRVYRAWELPLRILLDALMR